MQQCLVVWSNMRIQVRLPSSSPLIPRPALMIVYAVGAPDSGVEFLREIGRHIESKPAIDATLTSLVHRPRGQVPSQSHIHASDRSLLAFRLPALTPPTELLVLMPEHAMRRSSTGSNSRP